MPDNSINIPVLFGVLISPSPATAGQPVTISLQVEDVACTPSPLLWPSGPWRSGQFYQQGGA